MKLMCKELLEEKIKELESIKDPSADAKILLSTAKRELIILERLNNTAADSIGMSLLEFDVSLKNNKLYLIDEDEYIRMVMSNKTISELVNILKNQGYIPS